MDRRYQVFIRGVEVSGDILRTGVVQSVLTIGCIPSEAEQLDAGDDDDRNIARRAIGDSDYYLVIVGGRHAGGTAESIEHAEREFDHAVAAGLEVVALVQRKTSDIRTGVTAVNPAARSRLNGFHDKIKMARTVRPWHRLEDLPALTTLTLARVIRARPAVGWVRGDAVSNAELLSELHGLRKENDLLNVEVSRLRATVEDVPAEGVAGLEDQFVVRVRSKPRTHPHWQAAVVPLKWRDVFTLVGPYLFSRPEDRWVREAFGAAIARLVGQPTTRYEIDDDDFQTIKIHLRALGLIGLEFVQAPRAKLLWSLTPRGERLVLELRSVRSVRNAGPTRVRTPSN